MKPASQAVHDRALRSPGVLELGELLSARGVDREVMVLGLPSS